MACFLLNNGFSGHFTISDLPNRIPGLLAQKRWRTFRGKVDIIGLDFFRDSLPSSEIVLLDSILADWNDDSCITLLRRIKKILHLANGKLIVSEVTKFSESNHADIIGKLTLACAVSGRIRSQQEVEVMLRTAGYTQCQLVGSSRRRFTFVAS